MKLNSLLGLLCDSHRESRGTVDICQSCTHHPALLVPCLVSTTSKGNFLTCSLPYCLRLSLLQAQYSVRAERWILSREKFHLERRSLKGRHFLSQHKLSKPQHNFLWLSRWALFSVKSQSSAYIYLMSQTDSFLSCSAAPSHPALSWGNTKDRTKVKRNSDFTTATD